MREVDITIVEEMEIVKPYDDHQGIKRACLCIQLQDPNSQLLILLAILSLHICLIPPLPILMNSIVHTKTIQKLLFSIFFTLKITIPTL